MIILPMYLDSSVIPYRVCHYRYTVMGIRRNNNRIKYWMPRASFKHSIALEDRRVRK